MPHLVHIEEQPTLTGPVRASVLARDGHQCTWPACRSTLGLHVHHIVWRSRGGKTRPPNLTTLCGHHHRLVHVQRYDLQGQAPDALVFRRPTGELLLAPGQTAWTQPVWVEACDRATAAARAHAATAIPLEDDADPDEIRHAEDLARRRVFALTA